MDPDPIYLDNSATTPLAGEVIAAMKPYFSDEYGNASSLHRFGRRAHAAIEEARASLAETIGVEPSEIVFTSGATEADNLAIEPEAVKEAIRDDTLLVSIMAGNNEIGTIEPIGEIGEICKERGVPFHTDAVQAYGKVDIPAGSVDLLSVSAHKLNGPKGVGFLYVRKGIRLSPLLSGGGHERGRDSGRG